METFYAEAMELVTASIFYGLFFGMLASFVSPLYDWLRRW